MLNEFLATNVFHLFLVFARVGTALAILPGFSATYVNMRIRLVIALVISFLVLPVLATGLPPLPTAPAALAVLVVGEMVIGILIGAIATIAMAALHVTGTYVSYFASLANAFVQDPVIEQQSSTIAGFFTTLGLILIFVTDLHHVMIRAVIDSYGLFVPGQPLPAGDFAALIGRRLADTVILGAQLSAPFLLVSLTYYVGLGLLSRLMPQLPVFFFGLPINIGLQIWLIALTLSGMMMVFLNQFGGAIASLVEP